MHWGWEGLEYFTEGSGDFSCEKSLVRGSRGGNYLFGRSLQFLAWQR